MKIHARVQPTKTAFRNNAPVAITKNRRRSYYALSILAGCLLLLQQPAPAETTTPASSTPPSTSTAPAPPVPTTTPSSTNTALAPPVPTTTTSMTTIAPDALPTGGAVTAGQGSISQSGSNMVVTQQSQQMVAHWNTFNIGESASVRYNQPESSSIALNRISDQNPSQILGSLSANGQLYLVNPAGIIFGKTARVDVSGLVASALTMTDEEFMQGSTSFGQIPGSGPSTNTTPSSPSSPTSPASPTEPSGGNTTTSGSGSSTAAGQSSATTTSSAQTNTGPTTAPAAAAAITNQALIQTSQGGYVAFLAPTVKNEGTITANEGSVVLAGASQVSLDFAGDKLINYKVDKGAVAAVASNSGIISAKGGQVVMTAQAVDTLTRSVVNTSGRIEAKSIENSGGKIVLDAGGGSTTVAGQLDVSAKNGTGGTIQVTGDQVHLTGSAALNASGTSGGGTILIGGSRQGQDASVRKSQGTMIDQGAVITADAGNTGNGGNVVVWSDNVTDYRGFISARGGNLGGNGGEVEVSGKNHLSYLGLVDLRAPYGSTGTLLLDPANFTIGTDVTGAALSAQLGLTNVIVQTGNTGSDAGNIYVNEGVLWSSAKTLFLKAHNDILINQEIKNTGGGQLLLRADSDGDSSGTVTFAGAGAVVFTGGGSASLFYNPTDYAHPTSYAANFTGVTPTAYVLVNTVNQLQDINTNLGDKTHQPAYALGKDIDASATIGWNGGKGFEPIGDWDVGFNGIFDGLGHTISNLYINRPLETQVGLFGVAGRIESSMPAPDCPFIIRNVGLVDAFVKGDWRVGGLVGHAVGGNISLITNSYTTGTVSGNTGSDGRDIGGLVGINTTVISNSYSKAAVTGSSYVGGLVGVNWSDFSIEASVTNSYSAGAVSGGSSGGLVGLNYHTTPATPVYGSYWDKITSGKSTSAGGTGEFTSDMKTQGTFVGWDFTNTWGIAEGSSYPYLTGGTMGMTGTTVTLASTGSGGSTPDPSPGTGVVKAADQIGNANSPANVSISISSAPPTAAGTGNINSQLATNPMAIALQQPTNPFYSPWNSNVPYYSSWDSYMASHPSQMISWTEQAPHYDSWNDYLNAHPWFITAIAMNRSPQLDAEGNFIDGLVGSLDYLTNIGGGGLGFASLTQGGSYAGYSQTSGSYLTEQSWRATEQERLLQTLAAERPYDPEVAQMWQDAAVAKAQREASWQQLLGDLQAAGIDESFLELLTQHASNGQGGTSAPQLTGQGDGSGIQTENNYSSWLDQLHQQTEKQGPSSYFTNLLQRFNDSTKGSEYPKLSDFEVNLLLEAGLIKSANPYMNQHIAEADALRDKIGSERYLQGLLQQYQDSLKGGEYRPLSTYETQQLLEAGLIKSANPSMNQHIAEADALKNKLGTESYLQGLLQQFQDSAKGGEYRPLSTYETQQLLEAGLIKSANPNMNQHIAQADALKDKIGTESYLQGLLQQFQDSAKGGEYRPLSSYETKQLLEAGLIKNANPAINAQIVQSEALRNQTSPLPTMNTGGKGGETSIPLMPTGSGSGSSVGTVTTPQGSLSIELISEIFGSQSGFIFVPFL